MCIRVIVFAIENAFFCYQKCSFDINQCVCGTCQLGVELVMAFSVTKVINFVHAQLN